MLEQVNKYRITHVHSVDLRQVYGTIFNTCFRYLVNDIYQENIYHSNAAVL